MGRWYFDKKDTVENCRSVSISFLRKNGYFGCSWPQWIVWTNRDGEQTAGMAVSVHTAQDETCVSLSYTMTDHNTGEATVFDDKVQLVTAPCHFGGVRWWFICPLAANGVYCGRWVGILYRAPQADYCGCRHCHNLSYDSRNESRRGHIACMGHYLALDRQMEKLREQISHWTYRGIPTRKARRLHILEARMVAYSRTHLDFLNDGPGPT